MLPEEINRTNKPPVSEPQMKILNKVMLLPKLFCVFPFSSNNGQIRMSYALLSIAVSVTSVSVILSVWQGVFGPPGKSGWSVISTKVSRGSDTIHSLYATTSILTYAVKMRKINKFFVKLSEARKYLAGVGYSKKISVSYIIWWLDLSILCGVLAMNRWVGLYNIATTVNFFFIYAAGSTLIFMYCSFLKIIGKQLEFLNDKTQFLVQQVHFKEKTIQLARFSDVHHTLCSAAEALQESHGYPLVVLFLSYFIKILVLTRSMISSMKNPQFLDTQYSMALTLVSSIMKLGMIVKTAAFTSEQTKRFNQLLLENFVFQPNQDDWNIKLDLHLALNREVEFSAAGFFILDYPVLHSMLAMITSFLVVMIQTDKTPSQ